MPHFTQQSRITLDDVAQFVRHNVRMPQHSDVSAFAVIQEGVRLWEFVTICDDVYIGEDAVIGSHCFIGAGCHIGTGARLQSHVFLAPGTWVGDHAFLGPGVKTTDDKYPKVGHAYTPTPPTIGDWASIGAGAILLPGVHIGAGAMIGAGAVVSHDVPDEKLAYGHPAREQG